MLFQNENASLQLDVVNYELPAGAWAPGSDDCNWLVLRCTWHNENGDLLKDSNSCLMTYELQEMTAGLKVLHAGIRNSYESSFLEPYFLLAADARGRWLPGAGVLLPAQYHGWRRYRGGQLSYELSGDGRSDRGAGQAVRQVPGPAVRRA